MNLSGPIAFAFSSYVLVNAFTPGPGNILALNTMTNYGWKRGKPLFFGIFAGYFIVQALCALSVYGLERFLNPVLAVMKYAGAAYIFYLMAEIVRSKPQEEGSDKTASWLRGFILQFVNVKIYLFGITALTCYIVPHFQSLASLILFEMLIASVGTCATLTWIFFGGQFRGFYIRHFRLINILSALLLGQCAWALLAND